MGALRSFLVGAAARAGRVRIGWIAAAAGAGIAVFLFFGILQRTVYPSWKLANLDSERSVATIFSATLLWAAALGWFLVAVRMWPRARYLWLWSLVLAFLALDEGNAIHEKLERWLEIDWQIIYLPVLAVGATVWWVVMQDQRDTERAAALLLVGAAAWAGALLLELIQHWGGESATAAIYNTTLIIEEGLEMLGSTMFTISALLVLRHATEHKSEAARPAT